MCLILGVGGRENFDSFFFLFFFFLLLLDFLERIRVSPEVVLLVILTRFSDEDESNRNTSRRGCRKRAD